MFKALVGRKDEESGKTSAAVEEVARDGSTSPLGAPDAATATRFVHALGEWRVA